MGVGVVGGTSQLEAIYNSVTTAPKPQMIDPMLQPAFYVTSSNMYPSSVLIYNHYYQLIGTATQGNESYSMNQWNSSYGTEFNDNYGYGGANSGTGSGYQISAGVGHSNYFGNRYFEVSSSPSSNIDFKIHNRGNQSYLRNYAPWMHLGSIVSDSTSNAHKVLIGINTGGEIVLTNNSPKLFGRAFEYSSSSYGIDKASIASIFSAYSLSSVNAAISYNATTKKLVLIGRSSYSHYPIVIENVDHPALYLNNAGGWATHILSKSKIANTSSPAYNPTNTNESQYRAQVTITDTGRIYYFNMYTNWGYSSSYWDISGTSIGSNNQLGTRSYTTVYGIMDDASNGGGTQYNISNDTRYIFMYTQNYYYHGGFYGMVIDTKTGKALYDYQWQSSTFASIATVGKSDFVLSYATNADSGNGVGVKILNFENEFLLYNGSAGSNNAIKATSADPFNGQIFYWLDSPYHSTNYPAVFSMQGYDKALVGGQK